MKNKEFGSDFHFLSEISFLNLNKIENFLGQLYFSGRVALYEILNFGIEYKEWKKLYVPSYYCHEVYHFIKDLNIELVYYSYNPINNQVISQIEDNENIVVLIVNYFGIVSPNLKNLKKVSIIEDITHDLSLIKTSDADFIFGSLRKILPLPVGGFVKSKEQLRKLSSNFFAEDVMLKKSTAMYLKAEFLKGKLKSKDVFRNLFIEAEYCFDSINTVAVLPDEAKLVLDKIDLQGIIEVKKINLKTLKANILPNDIFTIFTTEINTDFAFILKFSDKFKRNELRNHLITFNIFPMVLWPNQIQSADKEVEDTILFIHVDYRYNEDDMHYIAKTINEYIKINNV